MTDPERRKMSVIMGTMNLQLQNQQYREHRHAKDGSPNLCFCRSFLLFIFHTASIISQLVPLPYIIAETRLHLRSVQVGLVAMRQVEMRQVPVRVLPFQCSIFISHLSTTDTIQSKQLTAYLNEIFFPFPTPSPFLCLCVYRHN